MTWCSPSDATTREGRRAARRASRAARGRGERVLTLAGLDVHPNYVLTKAESLDVDVAEMVAGNRRQITAAYDLAGIGCDVFLDPEEARFERAITGMLTEMVAAGTIPMRDITLYACADCGRTMHHSYVVGKCPLCGSSANGLSCEPCGAFTSAELLVDASCARCGGGLRPMRATVPVLPLEDYRAYLAGEWQRAELPGRVADGEIVLTLRDRMNGYQDELRCDLVLLGTGFEPGVPGLVRDLADACGTGNIKVSRNYRMITPPDITAGCYLQGTNETTHGIADSLISVIATRAAEISADLLAHRAKPEAFKAA